MRKLQKVILVTVIIVVLVFWFTARTVEAGLCDDPHNPPPQNTICP